jgi:hypothetical protein
MQQVNITVNDGSATPVPYTFTAMAASLSLQQDGSMEGIAYWKHLTGTAEAARSTLVLRSSFPNPGKASAFVVHRMVVKIPTMNTVGVNDQGITPATEQAYFDQMKAEFRFSQRTSTVNIVARSVLMANLVVALTAASAGVGSAAISASQPYN